METASKIKTTLKMKTNLETKTTMKEMTLKMLQLQKQIRQADR